MHERLLVAVSTDILGEALAKLLHLPSIFDSSVCVS